MQRLHGLFGWCRLAMAAAALGQLPATASADSSFTQIYRTPLKIFWATPLVPADTVPGYSAVGPPPVSTEEFSNELFVSGTQAPSLQFSLNPVEEEVVLGWRFKF